MTTSEPQHSPNATSELDRQQSWRFGLRDSMFWLSWFAVFSFLVASFGPRNEHFWAAVVFMLVMAIVGYALRSRTAPAVVVVLVVSFFFAGFFGPSFGLLTFLVAFFACLGMRWSSFTKRIQFRGFAIGILLALSVLLIERELALGGIRAARKRLPIVDYRPRLAKLRAPIANSDIRIVKKWTNLELKWDKSGWSQRRMELEQLHSRQYADFIASPGFGISRGPRLDPGTLQPIPPPKQFALKTGEPSVSIWPSWRQESPNYPSHYEERANTEYLNYSRPRMWLNDTTAVPNAWEQYPFPYDADDSSFHFHLATMQSFASPTSLGAGSESGKATGFVEHGFHHAPPAVQIGEHNTPTVFRLSVLQLISLIKNDHPVAYVTDELPSMETVNSETTPRRELDAFETQSLEQLYGGEDIVVETTDTEVRMLGALRAMPRCTECHGGNAGDLLGAFTYSLSSTN